MLTAVIFDMDGVLIDSEPIHFQAHKILMEKLNIKFDPQYYVQFIGTTTDFMWSKMIKDFNITYNASELMEMSNDIVKEILGENGYPAIEGAAELVRRLSSCNVKIALASSSGIERINNVLKNMKIENCFDEIVSGISVKNPKPAPDTFLQAAKQLGVEPETCLVIEDSKNGILAAKAAKMACVGFENQIGDSILSKQDTSNADYIVQSLSDLDISFFEMVHAHTFKEP